MLLTFNFLESMLMGAEICWQFLTYIETHSRIFSFYLMIKIDWEKKEEEYEQKLSSLVSTIKHKPSMLSLIKRKIMIIAIV